MKTYSQVFRQKHYLSFKIPYRLNWCSAYLDCAEQKVITSTINKYLHFSYNSRKDKKLCVYSTETGSFCEVSLQNYRGRTFNWQDYVTGCAAILARNNVSLKVGANIFIQNDLPSGLGLSSSACFITGIIKILLELNKIPYANNMLVSLAYQVEHDFLGIPCGLMDFKAILHPYGIWEIDTRHCPLTTDKLLMKESLNIALLMPEKTYQHIHLANAKFQEIAKSIYPCEKYAFELHNKDYPPFQYCYMQIQNLTKLRVLFENWKDKKLPYTTCDNILMASNRALNTLLETNRFQDIVGVQMLGSGIGGAGFKVICPDQHFSFGSYKVVYCKTNSVENL